MWKLNFVFNRDLFIKTRSIEQNIDVIDIKEIIRESGGSERGFVVFGENQLIDCSQEDVMKT